MRRAVALFEALVRESPENRDYRSGLADAQNDLGVYFEGYSTTLSGFSPRRDLAESERWFQRAVESFRSLLGRSPSVEDVGIRIRLASSIHNVAVIAVQTEHRSAAPGYYAESHQLLNDALKLEPNNDEAVMALGITLLNWGSFVAENPNTRAKGEGLIVKAIEALKPLVQREPTWAKPRFFLDDCYRTLAKSRDVEGRFTEALPYWEMAIALAEGEPREEFRTCQALDLARLGEHRKAWEMVRSFEPSLTSLSQHHSYAHRLIAACSACIGAARERPIAFVCGESSALAFSTATRERTSSGVFSIWPRSQSVPPAVRNCVKIRTWRPCSAAKTSIPCSRMQRLPLTTSDPPPLQSLAAVSEQIQLHKFFK